MSAPGNACAGRPLARAVRALLLSGGCLALPACGPTLPPVQAISATRIGDVETEAKRQLGVYQSAVNAARRSAVIDPTVKCGKGLIDFDIASVKMDLTTTFDTTDSASLGLTIPIGGSNTFGPSVSGSKAVTDTQQLILPIYPIPDPAFAVSDPKPAPIAQALLALRDGLLAGARADTICVYDYDYNDPAHDPGGSYTLGITVVKDPKVGIELKLAVVDLNVSHERKSTTGNTLTVTFHQHGLPDKPYPKDKDGIPIDPGRNGVSTPMLQPTAASALLPRPGS